MIGVVLCGGAGSRVDGADKPLLHWRRKPLLDHVLARLAPQVASVHISANRNLAQYQRRAPVVTDRWPDFQGPLAGLASVLLALKEGGNQLAQQRYLVCPGDMPLLPRDLGARLASDYRLGQPRYAHDGQRAQPLCMLCDASLLPGLLAYLASPRRSAMGWLTQCDGQPVPFDSDRGFANVNTSAELANPPDR